MTKYFKQIILGFALLTIVVNGLAEALPFNGISTAAISDKYRGLFTPAGYVFAIWGVIYIGWLAFAAYPFLTKKPMPWFSKVMPYFVLSSVANMLWLVLWHSEQLALSVLVMLVLLFSIVQMYRMLEIGVYKTSMKTSWMVHVPISIYLGWISVATIANISAFLLQSNWDRLGISAGTWTAVMILIAAVLAAVMILLRHDFAFAGVVVWALIGILMNLPMGTESIPMVIYLALAIIAITGAVKLWKKHLIW